jgi:hypothetical protein
MQRTMAWRFDGRMTIVVHGASNPSNLEWQGMLRDQAVRGPKSNDCTLVVSYGGGPDGRQRELLSKQMGNHPAPISVMTKSVIVRAIAVALRFFNRDMKVFGLEERKSAYDFVNLLGQERETADRIVRELEAELGLTALRSVAQRA